MGMVLNLLANDNYVISQNGFVRFRGINQSYTVNTDSVLSEFSTPLEIYWPISRETSLYLYTNYANCTGTDMTSLSGLGDTQLSWNYHLADQNIVMNVGLNMPTGKGTLTNNEFQTSLYLSQHFWDFNMPTFGQGFNISPGAAWAIPLSDAVVAGLGLSYQIRGGFIPISGLEDVYKPGNELLLTTGLDIRLASLSTFSWDFIYTSYASDKFADTLVYKSGSKIVTTVKFQSYIGYNTLNIQVRYRSKSKNQIASVTEPEKTYPNQTEFLLHYRYRHSPVFFMTYGLEGRLSQELALPGLNLIGIVFLPEYSMSKKSQLVGQLKYWTGRFSTDVTVSGFEVGIGMMYLF